MLAVCTTDQRARCIGDDQDTEGGDRNELGKEQDAKECADHYIRRATQQPRLTLVRPKDRIEYLPDELFDTFDIVSAHINDKGDDTDRDYDPKRRFTCDVIIDHRD